jgi:hypothetical protein
MSDDATGDTVDPVAANSPGPGAFDSQRGRASGPLIGIKVVDFWRFIAGSYGAMVLGDFGAEASGTIRISEVVLVNMPGAPSISPAAENEARFPGLSFRQKGRSLCVQHGGPLSSWRLQRCARA